MSNGEQWEDKASGQDNLLHYLNYLAYCYTLTYIITLIVMYLYYKYLVSVVV